MKRCARADEDRHGGWNDKWAKEEAPGWKRQKAPAAIDTDLERRSKWSIAAIVASCFATKGGHISTDGFCQLHWQCNNQDEHLSWKPSSTAHAAQRRQRLPSSTAEFELGLRIGLERTPNPIFFCELARVPLP